MQVINPSYKNSRGYTLIGMAIAMGVAGLLIAGVASALTIYYHNQRIEMSTTNTRKVVDAISNYLYVNGHYPCPAPSDAPSGTAGYGMPSDCTNVTEAAGAYDAAESLWVEESRRVMVLPDPPIGKVVRGVVPFRVLNIPEYETRDPYGNRLEYAVTLDLTSTSTYKNDRGGISLVDADDNAVLPIPDSLRFLVFSPGRDKVGGYSHEGGINLFPCDDASYVGKDVENCNTAPTGDQDKAVYRFNPMADLGTDEPYHYDDILAFSFTPGLPFWVVTDGDADSVWFDAETSGTLAVGYAEKEPIIVEDDLALKVKGDIKLYNSNSGAFKDLHTDYLCDLPSDDRNSSFEQPDCIAVADLFKASATKCPAGEFVQSIDTYGEEGLRLTCSAIVNQYKCPTGQVMTGLKEAGIICGYPPSPTDAYNEDTSCPDYEVNTCVSDSTGEAALQTLTAAAHGTERITAASGDYSYLATYVCNNRNWVYKSSVGKCDATCDSIVTDSYADYAFVYPTLKGPKDGWIGFWDVDVGKYWDVDVSEYRYCDENITAVTSALAPDDIICQEDSIEDIIEDCPSGYTGAIKITREWKCTPSAGWVETSRDDTSSPCVATAEATAPALVCPEGLMLDVPETSCVCDPVVTSQTRTRLVNSCGNLTEERTFTCAGRKWSPWVMTGCVAVGKKWYAPVDAVLGEHKLGPYKDKGSPYAVGDLCDTTVRRSCYVPALGGDISADGREQYYQYNDCECRVP